MTSDQPERDFFPLHDESSAPSESVSTLKAVRADFGMIPNLERVMAQSPELLDGYAHCWALFDRVTLSPVQRQVVYMTTNIENDCDYCVAWHSKLARMAGLDDASVEALRSGADLSDPELRALQVFTRAMIHRRGNPLRADLESFLAAGYSTQHALEVVLGIAIKTMSNFTNGLAGTPLDRAVETLRWKRPILRRT